MNNMVQGMKTPDIVTRTVSYTPASFSKISHDIIFLNPASNGNALFTIFCNAINKVVALQ